MNWHPWTININVTYGCNRRCTFCGIHSLPDKTPKFMDFKVFSKIIDELKDWKFRGKLDFSPFGEPFLNPLVFSHINHARKWLPKVYIFATSNSDPFLKQGSLDVEKVKLALDSGLNVLVLDCYDSRDQYDNLHTALNGKVALIQDNQYLNKNYNLRAVKLEKMWMPITEGTRRRFNVGGNANVALAQSHGDHIGRAYQLQKKCMYPMRSLTIMHDGKIVVCCQDWKKELVIGDIHEESLKHIWLGQKFKHIRRKLMFKQRTFLPCNKCDYFGGYRQGLYPEGIL